MKESIAQKIKALPPLPESIQEINKIYNSNDPSIPDLAKIIEKDPMLTANMLKTANSPLYNLRREVKSVLQAVSLFGLTTTRALCISISAKQLLKVDTEPYGVTPEDFANISNMQGAFANKWYGKINMPRRDFIFLCALLQEVGKIIIADEILKGTELHQFKSEIAISFNTDQVEKSFVDICTAEVTSAIFDHWNFDLEMVEAIKLSVDPINQQIENEDAIALYLIRKLFPINSPLSDRSLNVALKLLEKTKFDADIFKNTAEAMKL